MRPRETRELPEHWEQHVDERGRSYYANSETGETRWLPPPRVRKNATEVRTLLIQHKLCGCGPGPEWGDQQARAGADDAAFEPGDE